MAVAAEQVERQYAVLQRRVGPGAAAPSRLRGCTAKLAAQSAPLCAGCRNAAAAAALLRCTAGPSPLPTFPPVKESASVMALELQAWGAGDSWRGRDRRQRLGRRRCSQRFDGPWAQRGSSLRLKPAVQRFNKTATTLWKRTEAVKRALLPSALQITLESRLSTSPRGFQRHSSQGSQAQDAGVFQLASQGVSALPLAAAAARRRFAQRTGTRSASQPRRFFPAPACSGSLAAAPARTQQPRSRQPAAAAMDAAADEPTAAELATFQSGEAYVYAPLPPAPHYGHRAELWDVNKWLQVRWG